VVCVNQEIAVNLMQNNFPLDYEKYCMIRDGYNQKQVSLYNKCNSCHENTHHVSVCPYLNYRPNKNFIILKQNYSQNQERILFKRTRDYKVHHSYTDNQNIRETLKLKRFSLIIDAFDEEKE
jgi:hypothetical protein